MDCGTQRATENLDNSQSENQLNKPLEQFYLIGFFWCVCVCCLLITVFI